MSQIPGTGSALFPRRRLAHRWKPEIAAQVRQQLAGVIELADHGVLHLARPRAFELEVLDLLDEPTTR